MKVLVTGALGGIAQSGVVQVLEKDFELRLTDYKEPEKELKHEFIKADIRNYLEVKKVVKGFEAFNATADDHTADEVSSLGAFHRKMEYVFKIEGGFYVLCIPELCFGIFSIFRKVLRRPI